MTWYMSPAQKRPIRRALFEDQHGKCAYCSRHMTLDRKHFRKARHATLDHLTPLSLGGTNDPSNIVLCCRLCNIVKGHATLEEFVYGLLWVWLYKHLPLFAFEFYRRLLMMGSA